MLVLCDTNILLRTIQPSHVMHVLALEAQAELKRRGDQPCLVAQNLVEFRAVATRPSSVNGLGFTESKVDAEIASLKSLYKVFPDDPAIISTWESLVQSYGAVGKQNHDARIVAAMLVHGIGGILTFNKSDFVRYPNIQVLTPSELTGTSSP